MSSPKESKSTGTAAGHTEARLAGYQQMEFEDRRGFRAALALAGLAHLSLLLLQLPEARAEEPEDDGPRRIHMIETVRLAPPPKEPEAPPPPKPRARKVPIPDETPHLPEPIRTFEPTPIEMPEIPDVIFVPEAPPAQPEEPEGPIFVTGEVEKPMRIHTVQPRYSELARRVRLQGVVVLQSTIDKEGNVREVEVLRGLSMGLTQSAVDAVRQWRFKPAKLNGKPVAVYYTLTVRFELQ